MNKFLKKGTALLLAALMLLSFTSCIGIGMSAYDIAVKNGFEGDEEEWLESLRGEDGKDGENGKDGKDGKDGVDGTDGADGEDGKDGADGEKGEDGSSAVGAAGSASVGAALGLRSAVSVFSSFEKKEYAGYGKDPVTRSYSSAGAGVIYRLDKETGDAYIITNYHVVYDKSSLGENGISEDIKLYLYAGHYSDMAIDAKFVGGSATYDLAVLKVSGSELLKREGIKAVTLVNSDDTAPGTLAIAIGNPESEGLSVTSGVVSVDSEYIDMTALTGVGTVEMRLMRIDTPVNHGNSGGGLFDTNGNLIGIVNAKTEENGVDNIGYAIPANIVYSVAENVIANFEEHERSGVYKVTLGVGIQSSDAWAEFDSEKMQTLIREKILVSEITEGSLSEGILKVGDELVSVSCGNETRKINRLFTTIDFLLARLPGDEVEFNIIRDGKEMTVKVTLAGSSFKKVA